MSVRPAVYHASVLLAAFLFEAIRVVSPQWMNASICTLLFFVFFSKYDHFWIFVYF